MYDAIVMCLTAQPLGNAGGYVMTYYPEGVPCYYTYTAPFVCDGEVYYYRYDHDEACWDEDTLFCIDKYVEGMVIKFG